jgi:hypothetical protein
MMEGASEYVLVARTGVTFDALREAVGARGLPIVEDDARHRRLAFRLDRPRESGQTVALCAILDAGHGLSKIVVVCIDDQGGVVAPDPSLQGLFIQVEHTVHTVRGTQRVVALPPIQDGAALTEGVTP